VIRRGRFLVFAAFSFVVATACGGGHSTGAGGADATAPGDTGASTDVAIPEAGTATLSGPQAFPVGSASMAASPTGGCGGSGSPDVIAHVIVLLTAQGLPALLCTDAGPPDAGTGGWIDIEIATTQAATGDQELTQSLGPGTYVIGNEGEDDPDVCMLPPGSNAFLQLLTPGADDAQATAISGTVTIDSLDAKAITGSFSVLMGGPYGTTDASPPPSLSGTFSALACP